MSNDCAPIVVSVYDRLEHLRQCIDSLKQDPRSRESVLYVVSDGPHREAHRAKVMSVRDYIEEIAGFRRVVPVFRHDNMGSHESIKTAIDDIIDTHGRLIFLEDDNVVAPNFVSFVNDGLDFYRDDLSIFSICGYNYPVKMPSSYPHAVYKLQGYSAWGVGLWADRWRRITWNLKGFDQLTRRQKRKLRHVGDLQFELISQDAQYGLIHGDVIIIYNMFIHQQYSVFPVLSKVRNTGHDGSGEHCGLSSIYANQLLDARTPYSFVEKLEPNSSINRLAREYFKTPSPSLEARIRALRFRIRITVTQLIPKRQRDWLRSRLSSLRT